MNIKLREIKCNINRGSVPRFPVDENSVAELVNGNKENMPIESNSSETASTSTAATESVANEDSTNNTDPVNIDCAKSLCTSEEENNDDLDGEQLFILFKFLIFNFQIPFKPTLVRKSLSYSYSAITNNYFSPIEISKSGDKVHHDSPRMFHCFHCQLKLGNLNQFKTLKQVYTHWENEHINQLLTLPFYFYTTEYGNCVYCDHVGTYWELQKHSATKHPRCPLAITDIINYRKCALCSYIGDDIPKHSHVHRNYRKNFSSRHLSRMTNPLTYTDETYDERLSLRIHKKHRCLECGAAFDTSLLQRQHFLYKHPKSAKTLLKCNAKIFHDNSRQMICGCCCIRIPWNTFREHIKTVKLEFPCEQCSYTFTDITHLIIHDRINHNINNSTFLRTSQLSNRLKKYYLSTRIVHGNGLVITRQNIISTKFNDWPEYSAYIDELVEDVKSRLKNMNFMEMSQTADINEAKTSNSIMCNQDSSSISNKNDDKIKMDGDDEKSENSETNTSIPKPPKNIVYKHLSKGAGERIIFAI